MAAILFDLDGTLVDSVPTILACFRHAMRTVRGDVPPDDHFARWIGTPLRRGFEFVSNDDDEIEALMTAYKKRYFELTEHEVTLFDGAADAVRAVVDGGRKAAIVTSKSRKGTLRALRLSGLEALFTAVISADDVDEAKPAPAPVLAALAAMDVDAANAWFVGDSPHDIEAGRAAGVHTAAVRWGPFAQDAFEHCPPDRWLAQPREIPLL